jgi:hypothetical protein
MSTPETEPQTASGRTGLALARSLFTTYRTALLEKIPRELQAMLVAGLVGEGSECFGFDDELSRDHDWGPGFCLWLPDAELARWGPVLESALECLPAEFHGFPTRMAPEVRKGRTGILGTESFYARFLGIPRVPEHWREWRAIPEHHFAVCTNGTVFMDGPAEAGTKSEPDFTAIRNGLLTHYPDELRKKKIATRCALMAQSGQYNLLRSLTRGDRLTATLCAARFAEQALLLVHLLARKFMPFYKWAARSSAAASPLGARVVAGLDKLASNDLSCGAEAHHQTEEIVEGVCRAVVNELYAQRLSGAAGEWLMDHAHSVQSRIKDAELQQTPVLLD